MYFMYSSTQRDADAQHASWVINLKPSWLTEFFALFPNEAPFQRVFGGGHWMPTAIQRHNQRQTSRVRTTITLSRQVRDLILGRKIAAADVQTASMPQSGLSKLMIGQRSLEDPLAGFDEVWS